MKNFFPLENFLTCYQLSSSLHCPAPKLSKSSTLPLPWDHIFCVLMFNELFMWKVSRLIFLWTVTWLVRHLTTLEETTLQLLPGQGWLDELVLMRRRWNFPLLSDLDTETGKKLGDPSFLAAGNQEQVRSVFWDLNNQTNKQTYRRQEQMRPIFHDPILDNKSKYPKKQTDKKSATRNKWNWV